MQSRWGTLSGAYQQGFQIHMVETKLANTQALDPFYTKVNQSGKSDMILTAINHRVPGETHMRAAVLLCSAARLLFLVRLPTSFADPPQTAI